MKTKPVKTIPARRSKITRTTQTSWGWKLATTIDDALHFLNGTGTYQTPVRAARICAFWEVNHPEFYIYYQRDSTAKGKGAWSWKLATTPDDVQNFLSGAGPYGQPVKEVQITAYHKGNHDEFFIFYQKAAAKEPVYGNWGWKLATDPMDAMRFLNGDGVYRHPVTTARIALVNKGTYDAFYLFYQKAVRGDSVPNWFWKLATTSEDAQHFINGTEGYRNPVKGFEIVALDKVTEHRFYVFANQGHHLWLQHPLHNERFVAGEDVSLQALYTSEQIRDGRQLTWSSDQEGELGSGPRLSVNTFSTGVHQIRVSGYETQLSQPVRIYNDLWDFYQAAPSPAEHRRIDGHFEFNWIDGNGQAEQWNAYADVFDQDSTDPSKQVVYAKLDVLRHQDFTEPLPVTGGKKAYDHFLTFVHRLSLRLDCNFNTGGGGHISLNRAMSTWDGRPSGTPADPDACKQPMANPSLYPYISPLYLLLHEERHNEPGDPGHVIVNGSQQDPSLENGSGHAWAALYTMWVYKYGKYDPPAIKQAAKSIAKGLLESRFSSPPDHSDPKVQAIIDELLS